MRAGRPETHIGSVDELSPGDRVFILARVSSSTQDHRGNLDEQARDLRREAEARGAEVVGSAETVGSGWTPERFIAIFDEARGLNAVVLARDVSRLVRHWNYRGRLDQYASPGHHGLMRLVDAAAGVRLLTVTDPASPPAIERGEQVRAGQLAKGNRGGRPVKRPPTACKARRDGMMPEARELRSSGLSLRAVLGVLKSRHGDAAPSLTTITRWVKDEP